MSGCWRGLGEMNRKSTEDFRGVKIFCIEFKSLFFHLPPILLLFSRQVVSDSFTTPWTVAHQALPSMGFPRREYWSGFLLQGIFPPQGSNPCLLNWQTDSLPLSHQGSPPPILPWGRHLLALCLSFLFSKVEIIIIIVVV